MFFFFFCLMYILCNIYLYSLVGVIEFMLGANCFYLMKSLGGSFLLMLKSDLFEMPIYNQNLLVSRNSFLWTLLGAITSQIRNLLSLYDN